MTDADIAIIGAGPAGGSMAHAMAGRGWRTVLLERFPSPRHKACGEFLSPESLASLETLGLLPRIASLGPAKMEEVRISLAAGNPLVIPLPGTAWGVSRHALDHAILQAALERGVRWRPGAAVTSVTRQCRDYRIEWRENGQRHAMIARAVIGAWGRHPPPGLRPGDDPAPPSRPSLRSAWRPGRGHFARASFVGVSCHVAGLAKEPEVELFFFRGGYAGLAPVEGDRHNLAALVTRRFFREAGGTVHGVLEAAARGHVRLGRRLAGASPVPGSEAAAAPVFVSRRPVPWGAVPHVGDAAAVIPPLCGDGMAMALRSAALCAPLADACLRGELAPGEWKRLYTQAICAEWTGPLRWGNALQRLSATPALLVPLLGAGRAAPALARRLVRATRLPG
ncbi:MAG TPA: NAD(P)/FAD-dependent oxidoreductase [Paenibacillaceae bacterium]